MTKRLTEKNLYFYYKLLCAITQKQFFISHWEDRYKLFCNTKKGNQELSRNLSLTEMYEVLYSMTRTLETMNGKYEYATGNILYLSKKDSKLLDDNLHNDEYIRVINE